MVKALRTRRGLILAGVVLLALAAGGVYLSLAVFTSSSKNTSNASSGKLAFTLAPSGSVVDTASLRPGDTRTGSVTLTNTQLPATFTLLFTGLGTGPLPTALGLTVAETAPVAKTLYNGALSAVTPLALGKLATNGSVTLTLTFSWPAASTDPALQAQSVPLVLQWDATT